MATGVELMVPLCVYPGLYAGQRRPLQALHARSVGDDHHYLRRAGRALGLLDERLQVGA